MVIERSTAFAMRCPQCGRQEITQINIFQLSGNTKYEVYCECGSQKAAISKKGANHIAIEYKCIICDYPHTTVILKENFWSRNHFSTLVCLNTNLNLGYFGPFGMIKKELDRQQQELDSMATDLGFDDFVDPEIMLDVLDILHDISAAGDLCCECGNQEITIELYSDKIELGCYNCNATLVIPASRKKDLDKLKICDEIILHSSSGANKNPRGPWINI